jgi:hypothetical protein
MNLLQRALTLLVFCAGCFAASAQAIPAAIGPGPYVLLGGGVSAFQADYGKRVLGGAMVYSDMHFSARAGLEAEARFLRFHTDEDVTQSTYLLGPHVYVFRTAVFKPYVKVLAGVGHMQFPFKYATGSYLAVAGGGGLDLKISPRIFVRAVDVEYQSWPQFTYGSLHPYGVSFGIGFRLTPLSDTPHGGRH